MITARWLLAGVLLAGAGLSGCGELDPAVGPPRVAAPSFEPAETDGGEADVGEPCDIVDSDPETDVRFPEVLSTVFRGFCGCHTDPGGVGQTIGGLDLSTLDSALEGGLRGGDQDVVPGDACRSNMVGKISGMPPFGSPMPFSRAPLTPENRQLVVDWIAEGARP